MLETLELCVKIKTIWVEKNITNKYYKKKIFPNTTFTTVDFPLISLKISLSNVFDLNQSLSVLLSKGEDLNSFIVSN